MFSLLVGSTDRGSSQQLQMWFSKHFSRQNLLLSLSRLLFLLRWNKYGAKKCLQNHIPFDFWDDSTLANQGAGKTIEKPLNKLPWNQQYSLYVCHDRLESACFGLWRSSGVWSVKPFELGIHTRVAKRTKYKMLSAVHKCCLRLQAKSFSQLRACACTFIWGNKSVTSNSWLTASNQVVKSLSLCLCKSI